MAKKAKVNKRKAVRDYVKAHPDATSREISAALAKKGIAIATNRVSYVRNLPLKRTGLVAEEIAVKQEIGLPEIKAAISLLALTRSIKEAKRALTTTNVNARQGMGGHESRAASLLLEIAGGIDEAHAALAAAQEARAML
jgi:hypothetical protein